MKKPPTWPPGVEPFSRRPLLTPGDAMTVEASQALASQHLGVCGRRRGRRRVPTPVQSQVQRPVSQRWRERPRCPAPTVAPGEWRRGRSRHRRPCPVSSAAQSVCPGGTRRPSARVRGAICLDDRAPRSTCDVDMCTVTLFGRLVRRYEHRTTAGTVALFSVAPCSASSMSLAT